MASQSLVSQITPVFQDALDIGSLKTHGDLSGVNRDISRFASGRMKTRKLMEHAIFNI